MHRFFQIFLDKKSHLLNPYLCTYLSIQYNPQIGASYWDVWERAWWAETQTTTTYGETTERSGGISQETEGKS